ncbi:hypothetical protein [Methylococcus geothermalis]|uniref:hypothetical protein n=1 Tax=Methylococcus geothermalis TaxID=2681310 RepID=UPI001E3EB431|nr:hypothetical protein [Methylococcus geothermalis]
MRHHTGIVSIALFTGIILAGCSTIRTRTPEGSDVTMNEKEFAVYVEHVFRHHNRILNELITSEETSMGTGDIDADDLEEAETDMIRTCDPLNEIVAAEAEQRHASFSTILKLADVVPECESRTRELEALLHPTPSSLTDTPAGKKDGKDSGASDEPATHTAP